MLLIFAHKNYPKNRLLSKEHRYLKLKKENFPVQFSSFMGTMIWQYIKLKNFYANLNLTLSFSENKRIAGVQS